MEKENNFPEKDIPSKTGLNQNNELREPAIEYGYDRGIKIKGSPPLTEEELKDSMNGEEFIEHWCKCIDRLFDK